MNDEFSFIPPGDESNLNALINQKLETGKIAELEIARFNPKYKESPIVTGLEGVDVYNYYLALKDYRYISNYIGRDSHKIYTLKILDIKNKLQAIQKDSRVAGVFKSQLFSVIDLFTDIRLQLDLLSRLCFTEYERGKTGNWVHGSIKTAMEYEEKKINTPYFKDQIEILKNNSFFLKIKTFLFKSIKILSRKSGINEEELYTEVMRLLSGDLRKLEKDFLPRLYWFIYTKKDADQLEGKSEEFMARPSAIKKDLLFDLLPLICPDKKFYSSVDVKEREAVTGKFYNGSYFQYRINTVKNLFGK
jgi:hypothetical protein